MVQSLYNTIYFLLFFIHRRFLRLRLESLFMSLILYSSIINLDAIYLMLVNTRLNLLLYLVLSISSASWFFDNFLFLLWLICLLSTNHLRLSHNLVYPLCWILLCTILVKLQVTMHQIVTCLTQYDTSFLLSATRSYLVVMLLDYQLNS